MFGISNVALNNQFVKPMNWQDNGLTLSYHFLDSFR